MLGQTFDALGGSDTLVMSFYPNEIVPDGHGLYFGDILDPASIGTNDIVYTLDNQSANNYLLTGYHDVLAAQPVADYGINLHNFESIRFNDGTDVLDINLATDIGVIDGSSVTGLLDGATLAASYLFASYDVGGVGSGVTQVIGGAVMADTVGISFAGISALTMEKTDATGPTPAIWHFMDGASEVFNVTEAGTNNWAIDYAATGAGTDVSLSDIEYLTVLTNDHDALLRLSFQTGQPTVIV